MQTPDIPSNLTNSVIGADLADPGNILKGVTLGVQPYDSLPLESIRWFQLPSNSLAVLVVEAMLRVYADNPVAVALATDRSQLLVRMLSINPLSLPSKHLIGKCWFSLYLLFVSVCTM